MGMVPLTATPREAAPETGEISELVDGNDNSCLIAGELAEFHTASGKTVPGHAETRENGRCAPESLETCNEGPRRGVVRDLPGRNAACTEASRVLLSQPAAGPPAQMDLTALDARVKVHEVLTRLRADLRAVEDAIQALELIEPDGKSKYFCGPSRPRPETAQMPKRRKVFDIQTKRR
jgi:hypothetical protein